MWPWSTIRELRLAQSALYGNVQSLLDQLDQVKESNRTARGERGVALAKLELANRTVERLELDLEGARSDHRRLVTQLVSLAHGRASGALNLTVDPFAEEKNQPDVWLQPEDGDVDIETLTQELGTLGSETT